MRTFGLYADNLLGDYLHDLLSGNVEITITATSLDLGESYTMKISPNWDQDLAGITIVVVN